MTISHKLNQNRYPLPTQLKAFTLVEILVVMAIISVLMTIATIGIGNLSAGKGTAAAIATSESLFDEARSIAVSKRCATRVMIDVDDPSDDRYLRRIVIVHESIDSSGNVVPGQWILANRGYVMPQGTYFSKKFSTWNGAALPQQNLSGGNVSADFQGNYAYYEFNAEGICLQPGAKFIIGTGIRAKGQVKPQVTKAAERDFAGFAIWRNGRTSSFRSTDQMDIPQDTKKF